MRNILILFILSLFSYQAFSQQITYSLPESEDVRSLDFDIIGKINGNFLVYKNIRNKYAIAVYDNRMKLKDKVSLDFMPDRTINVDLLPIVILLISFTSSRKKVFFIVWPLQLTVMEKY